MNQQFVVNRVSVQEFEEEARTFTREQLEHAGLLETHLASLSSPPIPPPPPAPPIPSNIWQWWFNIIVLFFSALVMAPVQFVRTMSGSERDYRVGPRGGVYYVNRNGNRQYVNRPV